MMNRLRLRAEGGFTLIELLVVVAIIGILAAIAIPQFSAYRKQGYEAQVKSDLRNAATAEEAYFTQNFAYKTGTLSSGTPSGFNKTADTTIAVVTATAADFTIRGTHSKCASGAKYTFKSSDGSITAAGTAC